MSYDLVYENLLLQHPLPVHMMNNVTAQYFRKYLLQKALSVFVWDGMPDTWSKDYFLYTLYMDGKVAVFDTQQFGVIPNACSYWGYNVFYEPAGVTIHNPCIPQLLRLEIGKDCEIIRLQPDWSSPMDIVDFYAWKMAMAAEAVDADLLNSKLSYVMFANKSSIGNSLKKIYDKYASGEPAIVIDKQLLDEQGNPAWQAFTNDLKKNYIVSDLLADMKKIECMFDTTIGIPNANTDKRERLITDEVNANNVETMTRAELWLDTIRKCLDKVNNMFGLNLSVDWRHDPNEDEPAVDPVDLGTGLDDIQ